MCVRTRIGVSELLTISPIVVDAQAAQAVEREGYVALGEVALAKITLGLLRRWLGRLSRR